MARKLIFIIFLLTIFATTFIKSDEQDNKDPIDSTDNTESNNNEAPSESAEAQPETADAQPEATSQENDEGDDFIIKLFEELGIKEDSDITRETFTVLMKRIMMKNAEEEEMPKGGVVSSEKVAYIDHILVKLAAGVPDKFKVDDLYMYLNEERISEVTEQTQAELQKVAEENGRKEAMDILEKERLERSTKTPLTDETVPKDEI